jgi:hypothetical protein
MDYMVLHRHAIHHHAAVSFTTMVLVYADSKGVGRFDRGNLLGQERYHLLRHLQRSLVRDGRFCAGANAMVFDMGFADEVAGKDWSRDCHEHGSLVRVELLTHGRKILT